MEDVTQRPPSPRPYSTNEWVRDILAAVEERGYSLTRFDIREGVVIEEPVAAGVTIRLSGRTLSPEFIRSLPIARMPV